MIKITNRILGGMNCCDRCKDKCQLCPEHLRGVAKKNVATLEKMLTPTPTQKPQEKVFSGLKSEKKKKNHTKVKIYLCVMMSNRWALRVGGKLMATVTAVKMGIRCADR